MPGTPLLHGEHKSLRDVPCSDTRESANQAGVKASFRKPDEDLSQQRRLEIVRTNNCCGVGDHDRQPVGESLQALVFNQGFRVCVRHVVLEQIEGIIFVARPIRAESDGAQRTGDDDPFGAVFNCGAQDFARNDDVRPKDRRLVREVSRNSSSAMIDLIAALNGCRSDIRLAQITKERVETEAFDSRELADIVKRSPDGMTVFV